MKGRLDGPAFFSYHSSLPHLKMAQYKTTNSRPVSFKFGPVTIRVGKKPAEIDSKYAERILKQYPGWIERVGPAAAETPMPATTAESKEQQPAATAETALDDHQETPTATELEAQQSEAEAPAETTSDDHQQAAAPDPVPAETPTPAAPAKKTAKAPAAKTGKKASSKA